MNLNSEKQKITNSPSSLSKMRTISLRFASLRFASLLFASLRSAQGLKTAAEEKLATALSEIEDLERQLLSKRKERDDVAASLQLHNAAITAVRAKFDRQLARLQVREEAAKQARGEWTLESEALIREVEDLEREEEEVKRRGEAVKSMVRKLKTERGEIEELIEVWKSDIGESQNNNENNNNYNSNDNDDINNDNNDDSSYNKYNKSIQIAEERIKEAEKEVTKLISEMNVIKLKIPTMEVSGRREFER